MSLSQNELDWFAARLSIAIEDTRRETREMQLHDMRELLKDEPGCEDLTIEYQDTGTQKLTLGNKVLMVGPMASNAEILLALKNVTIPTANTKVIMTTPISRLRDKLVQARGVAQRVVTNVEAEADALIGEEDAIKAQTAEAFAPHKAILAESRTELQAVKDALNLMSNGGPPLEGSDTTVKGS